MRLRWTKHARDDLIAIRRFIALDDARSAEAWVERLRERVRQAAEMPGVGRVVPELDREEIREVLLRNYRIVYRVGTEEIVVLTVFEGHRLLSPNDVLD